MSLVLHVVFESCIFAESHCVDLVCRSWPVLLGYGSNDNLIFFFFFLRHLRWYFCLFDFSLGTWAPCFLLVMLEQTQAASPGWTTWCLQTWEGALAGGGAAWFLGWVLLVVGLILPLPSTASYLCVGDANLGPPATMGLLAFNVYCSKIPLSSVLSSTVPRWRREFSDPMVIRWFCGGILPSIPYSAIPLDEDVKGQRSQSWWRSPAPPGGWLPVVFPIGFPLPVPPPNLVVLAVFSFDLGKKWAYLGSLLLLSWDSWNTWTGSPSSFGKGRFLRWPVNVLSSWTSSPLSFHLSHS